MEDADEQKIGITIFGIWGGGVCTYCHNGSSFMYMLLVSKSCLFYWRACSVFVHIKGTAKTTALPCLFTPKNGKDPVRLFCYFRTQVAGKVPISIIICTHSPWESSKLRRKQCSKA